MCQAREGDCARRHAGACRSDADTPRAAPLWAAGRPGRASSTAGAPRARRGGRRAPGFLAGSRRPLAAGAAAAPAPRRPRPRAPAPPRRAPPGPWPGSQRACRRRRAPRRRPPAGAAPARWFPRPPRLAGRPAPCRGTAPPRSRSPARRPRRSPVHAGQHAHRLKKGPSPSGRPLRSKQVLIFYSGSLGWSSGARTSAYSDGRHGAGARLPRRASTAAACSLHHDALGPPPVSTAASGSRWASSSTSTWWPPPFAASDGTLRAVPSAAAQPSTSAAPGSAPMHRLHAPTRSAACAQHAHRSAISPSLVLEALSQVQCPARLGLRQRATAAQRLSPALHRRSSAYPGGSKPSKGEVASGQAVSETSVLKTWQVQGL
jgi:hypothetical protein